MLFNSYIFILLFLPTVWSIYFILNTYAHYFLSKIWLVLASFFFYAWWNSTYLLLILSSIAFNYAISYAMQQYQKQKKFFFLVGLFFNIGLLAYYKYMDFFISNINLITHAHLSLLHLILPLGISFFTLQQVAFLVDSYQGLVKEKKFLDYALFVSFFPQLIAGPIVHHKSMMPQFADKYNKQLNYNNIVKGLFLFSIGLFKKVMIADYLAEYVNLGFDKLEHLSILDAWQSSLAYTFQLYYDFSAYSDMAIGIALLFNIKLPQNFNSPLKATGMIDYWKRWHMTLTGFITSYIYTPIVRTFRPLTLHKAMFATIIVFLISGIWHGAGWTFVVWGLLHGFAVVTNHYWQKLSPYRLHPLFAWFITFQFVNFANVLFRAKNFEDAYKVIKSMVDYHTIPFVNLIPSAFGATKQTHLFYLLIFSFIITFAFKNASQHVSTLKFNYKTLLWASVLFAISLLSMDKVSEFIYFNF